MTHVHRPPTITVATTLANNDARLRCDRRNFMPDVLGNFSAGDKGGQQSLAMTLYVFQGKIVV